MNTHRIAGNLLVKHGVIDADGLARVLGAPAPRSVTIGRALADIGLASEETVARTLAAAFQLDYYDRDPQPIDEGSVLPVAFCVKRRVIPLGSDGASFRIAVTDPLDYGIVQETEFLTAKRVTVAVVTETWLERSLSKLLADGAAPGRESDETLDDDGPVGELEVTVDAEYELVDPATLAKDSALPPVVRLVNRILSEAARVGASDVHIEPQESLLQVRNRVDGLLREAIAVPRRMQDQVVSRLKVIAGMDITERRKPQDGRSRLRFEGRRIDLRVSTLPTQFGEKVVIRFLNPDGAIHGLDRLGLRSEDLEQFRALLARPQGLILVTGPTGSGKTSTLYSALAAIASPTNNIITLEDPIEFRLAGINQTQINPRAGITFANGLRSILRQDPNIILVGEIRDRETAEVALQAAQTGHLLLSTVHTNDAPATITRLSDLGVPAFLIASSLIGVVAQRLVRRPCPECLAPVSPPRELIERVGGAAALPSRTRWLAGSGCDACERSGYRGRTAIHEFLVVTEETRALIAAQASEASIRTAARQAGMRTLLEDGVAKAAQGLTTLEEVLRMVPTNGLGAGAAAEGQSVSALAGDIQVSTSASSPSPTARRRVLVVDDSPTIVSVVKYFLELEGFDVIIAEDGLRGLDAARRKRPDLIVSDVNMPGMTGVELVRAIRQDERTRHMSVLLLTSESSVDQETAGLSAGADDYLLKPVEPRRLAARVKTVLGRGPMAPAHA